MLLDLCRTGLLFTIIVFGLGLPFAWLTPAWPPLYRLCAAIAGALVVVYLWSFAVYLADLSPRWHYALPCVAILLIIGRWRATIDFLSLPEIKRALGLWLLLAVWSIGLQCLVINYSGGAWMGDLWEHYDRARFFLEHWPLHSLVFGNYALPARPPLINLITASLLAQTGTSFVQYQIFTTLQSTLPFLPAMLWVMIFGGKPAHSLLLLLLFLASPLFAVNVTFPATKMMTAFFVLTGLALLHRDALVEEDQSVRTAGWLAFAAGFLAHYSAGPWIVAVVLAILAVRRRALRTRAFWRGYIAPVVLSAALCATWFGWSYRVFGWEGTAETNTTVTGARGRTATAELTLIVRNIRDTIVPHVWRQFDKRYVVQKNPFGALRDFFFYLYQVNLFFEFGSVGGVIIAYLVLHHTRTSTREERWFWFTLVGVAIVVGIAVNSERDPWGLAHVCLKPLALLGLAYLAAKIPALPPVFRGLFTAGVLVDFFFGVVLQFGLESLALDRWIAPGQTVGYYASALGLGGRYNFECKENLRVLFLGDYLAPDQKWTATVLAMVLLFALLAYSRACRKNLRLAKC